MLGWGLPAEPVCRSGASREADINETTDKLVI